MSGTIGINTRRGPWALMRSLPGVVSGGLQAVRNRGGLSLPVALPAAFALTAGLTWVIVAAAGRMVVS